MQPDPKIVGFPASLLREKYEVAHSGALPQTETDISRPPPLAICASACLLNSGSEKTFGYPRHAPSLTAAGDGLKLRSRRRDFGSPI
jgi:hypothetical protein